MRGGGDRGEKGMQTETQVREGSRGDAGAAVVRSAGACERLLLDTPLLMLWEIR